MASIHKFFVDKRYGMDDRDRWQKSAEAEARTEPHQRQGLDNMRYGQLDWTLLAKGRRSPIGLWARLYFRAVGERRASSGF